MSNEMSKKVTLATVKSFIKKNLPNLYIMTSSRFDGMVDGVRRVEGAAFRKVTVTELTKCEATLGIEGVWFVRGSRDYFTPINKDGFVGYEVYNCCGTWTVAVKA
jgi:hypothetical protein